MDEYPHDEQQRDLSQILRQAHAFEIGTAVGT